MPSEPSPSPKPLVFSPGPTALHPDVATAMREAVADGFLSESHRSRRFRSELEAMVEALESLLGIPDGHLVLVVGSATEAMERIVQGVVAERSAHLVNGAFARRFRDIAVALGKGTESRTLQDGEGFSAAAHTGTPLPGEIDLLAVTQNETSTGARIPPSHVHALAQEARSRDALVAVDLVTGWPTEGVEPAMIDAGFFSVQKAFGLPAGLGVIVASPRLVERSRRLRAEGKPVGGYLSLPALADAAIRSETRVTPNMLGIRLLRTVAERYAREGREALERDASLKADEFWQGLAGVEGLVPFVTDPEVRSRTVLVVETEGDSGPVVEWLGERGYVVAPGYGPWRDRHIRIANFPVQTAGMMRELLAALEVLPEELRLGRR
jgi:phosphoserine aminotransferase